MKIGIFGGSFDPVHIGHTLLAKKALKQLELDFLFFTPAYLPPHKSRKLVSAFHRKKMLQLAIDDCKKFLISDFELNRKKKTYTYQTLNYFQRKYPEAKIYFIFGSDLVGNLNTWTKLEKLTQMCKFAVGKRKHYPFDKKNGFIELSGKIADISSTDIREKIKNGFSVNGLVPIAVENYIKKNGLYFYKK